MFSRYTPYSIILASSSPRRSELLQNLGLKFSVVKPNFNESIEINENILNYIQRNSEGKAYSIAENLDFMNKKNIIIAADTIVTLDNTLLEKPQNIDDAKYMLKLLSGKTHTVHSSVSIIYKTKEMQKRKTKYFTTKVTLSTLNDKTIQEYIATGEPFDKSGAYGIQGIGSSFVKSIEGSYTNVVGLPLHETLQIIDEIIKET